MLKQNQEKEDVRYWALKQKGDEFEVQSLNLQWDKSRLQNVVQGHEKDIFKTQRRDLDYYAPKG
jgi:hypothetical protein